jgi:hypothetical protein
VPRVSLGQRRDLSRPLGQDTPGFRHPVLVFFGITATVLLVALVIRVIL